MMISVVSVILFLLLGVRKGAVIPGYLQAAVEYVYDFVTSIIESNTGSKGLKHIPLVFTVFTFTLSCNLVGMLPYSFTLAFFIVSTVVRAKISNASVRCINCTVALFSKIFSHVGCKKINLSG